MARQGFVRPWVRPAARSRRIVPRRTGPGDRGEIRRARPRLRRSWCSRASKRSVSLRRIQWYEEIGVGAWPQRGVRVGGIGQRRALEQHGRIPSDASGPGHVNGRVASRRRVPIRCSESPVENEDWKMRSGTASQQRKTSSETVTIVLIEQQNLHHCAGSPLAGSSSTTR